VENALAATNTRTLAERVFNELSGGERQRVLLALALAQDAPIVLLDEPTAHLDIRHQIETLDLLRRLNRERGITVLAALHDLNLASRYFPRLVLIRTHILADGPPAQVLRDDLLSRAYDIPVRVGILRGEEHLSIVPPAFEGFAVAGQVIHVAENAHAPAPCVHVLAGGGSGELLMRTLADAGIPFTAGPLNAGDTDHALAERLAMQTLGEPPYAPVSAQGLDAARDLIRAAGAVVVCPMPIGPGNLALLDAALDARRAGLSVMLLEPARLALSAPSGASENEMGELAALAAIAARDFSGGAAERYTALAEAGAVWADSPAEVVALLAG
jgi:cobalamin transport system ATP-binding protein